MILGALFAVFLFVALQLVEYCIACGLGLQLIAAPVFILGFIIFVVCKMIKSKNNIQN